MLKKKMVFAVILFFVLGLFSPLMAVAETKGAACDPKKIEDCCVKIEKTIGKIDVLRAKLLKLQAELKAGKQVSNAQADEIINKVDKMDSDLENWVGSEFDYQRFNQQENFSARGRPGGKQLHRAFS